MPTRLTADRKRFLAEKNRTALAAQPRLRLLRRRLLALGGAEVVLRPEPHLEILLARAVAWRRAKPRLLPGERNGCHLNVSRTYQEDPERNQIVTGWALHPGDVVWRQHSWILCGAELVETTTPARLYYGVVLEAHEADRFARMELAAAARRAD